MTPRELRALPEVDCPEGGAECCGYTFYGRRICGFPREAHLDIVLLLFQRRERELQQRREEKVLLDDLDRALHTHPWLR